MKKRLAVSVMALMFFCGIQGCTSLSCSKFTDHSSIWKSWDHYYFSNFGYKNPTPDVVKKSIEQEWWGCPVEVEANK